MYCHSLLPAVLKSPQRSQLVTLKVINQLRQVLLRAGVGFRHGDLHCMVLRAGKRLLQSSDFRVVLLRPL